jgi:predicted GIY-YIG superfamily endonuclease
MSKKFDDWFNSIEGYHLLSERFYTDLDNLVYCKSLGLDQEAKEAESDIKDWLREAFEAGVESEKENN